MTAPSADPAWISLEELQLATRNHGMPLEALRYPITPLGLDDLLAVLAEEVTVTMECAGNGRARLAPRPISQPWLAEAVGTARWRGTALRPLLEEAGIADGAVE